jgi:hypothetical protein
MRFEEYVQFKDPLHDIIKLPMKIEDLENLILYGPSGVGKYTLALRMVQKYSKSVLKYEKRVLITTSTIPFYIKISDVHCEVDMEQLGCNAKVLWHDLFTHIQYMYECTFPKTNGLIVCTNFHAIHSELLEIFYSYMQQKIKFILITEAVSFLPAAVTQRCRVVAVPRPSKTKLVECFGERAAQHSCSNLRQLTLAPGGATPIDLSTALCEKVVAHLQGPGVSIAPLREDLYALLVHNLVVDQCLWFIARRLLPQVPSERMATLLQKITFSLQCYASNYRPIFHLEYFVCALWVAKQRKT